MFNIASGINTMEVIELVQAYLHVVDHALNKTIVVKNNSLKREKKFTPEAPLLSTLGPIFPDYKSNMRACNM